MRQANDPRKHLYPEWVGKRCVFKMGSKILRGIITKYEFIGFKGAERAPIPDYQLTIQGQSGKQVSVSMWESFARIKG